MKVLSNEMFFFSSNPDYGAQPNYPFYNASGAKMNMSMH